jgi:hypothetical protein
MISISRPRVRKWSPTPEQAEFLRAVEPTSRFLHNLPDEILRKHSGQWVAARECKIIASAPTRAELDEALGDLDDPYTLKLRLEKGINIRWRRPS